MEIINILERLEKNKEFKEWKKKNKDSFLAHVFKMLDDENKDDWQVGYYNKDDTITTFILTPNDIKIADAENIFKRPDAKVQELDKKKIRVDITKALEATEKIQTKEYKQEIPYKIIIILQKLDIGQVYNITYITQSFKILNFKIDCSNCKVLKKTLQPIMEFKVS